mmetsp:Transcript_4095/g.6723  ORF Transcript_4095/g.6723 Transcript_4095/m.6723 type:complete len:209 (+) Transcript_4095:126-752(+)
MTVPINVCNVGGGQHMRVNGHILLLLRVLLLPELLIFPLGIFGLEGLGTLRRHMFVIPRVQVIVALLVQSMLWVHQGFCHTADHVGALLRQRVMATRTIPCLALLLLTLHLLPFLSLIIAVVPVAQLVILVLVLPVPIVSLFTVVACSVGTPIGVGCPSVIRSAFIITSSAKLPAFSNHLTTKLPPLSHGLMRLAVLCILCARSQVVV